MVCVKKNYLKGKWNRITWLYVHRVWMMNWVLLKAVEQTDRQTAGEAGAKVWLSWHCYHSELSVTFWVWVLSQNGLFISLPLQCSCQCCVWLICASSFTVLFCGWKKKNMVALANMCLPLWSMNVSVNYTVRSNRMSVS